MIFRIIILLLATSSICTAQPDSVFVSGRIQNYSGEHYRQNPAIYFTRNNIFLPNSEIIVPSEIQPDGSFKAALPLHYWLEEFQLEFGSDARATFLGSKGEISIKFDANQIGKSKDLFEFSGEHALENNLYDDYIEMEKQAFSEHKVWGDDFFDTFWSLDIVRARPAINTRKAFREELLKKFSKKYETSDTFALWLTNIFEVERLSAWIDYLMINDIHLVIAKVTPDIIYNSPLTYEKVLLAQKYQKYANDFFKSAQLNDGVKLVPVSYHKMTGIILEQVTQLQSADKERLEVISSKKKISLEDSLKVNELYSKNYDSIFYLVDFEQAHNLANLIQNPEMIDFLDANYLIQQAALLTITQKLVLFEHIKKKLKHANILNSLSERIHIQTKDSVAIKKLMAYHAPIEKPSEVTDGIYISNSDEKGHKWLNNVLQSYKGKTVYLVKWSINDPENLQKLQNIAYLRSALPENVVFLFIHLVKNELDSHLIPLAKQNILVQHLEGTHLFPTPNQITEMKLRIPPLESDTYLIIKPNGKVLKTKTPSLDDVNLLTSVLLHAAE